MPADSVEIIQRARHCTKCDYNLYSLPREGTCPECGHAYKRRKNDGKPKNPRRQLGRLRWLERSYERQLRFVPVPWAIAVSVVTGCYFLDAGKWAWGIAVCTVVFAIGQHASAVMNCRDIKRKIEAIDARSRTVADSPQPSD